MAIAIISDIHSNLEALETALDFIDSRNIEEINCLGDIVGYGPNPNECVQLIRERCDIVLMGNHDYAAIGLANVDYFNEYAKIATQWTMNALSRKNVDYLKTLPFSHQTDDALMVHSSPTNPSHWYYVLSLQDALIEMRAFTQPICFIGHSHVPGIFSKKQIVRTQTMKIEPNEKYIVNVGSVGQPRDGIPESSIVIYDPDARTIEYKRLEYDIKSTYSKIIRAGLPVFLAERLLKGY